MQPTTSSNRTGSDRQEPTDDGAGTFDRRTVLKIAGGTAVTVAAFSGSASAHNGKFFGCERVCSGTDGDYAVVAVDGGYECRTLEKAGPLEDVPWDWDAHCYTADDDEVVVGYVAENEYKEDRGCWVCVNPNDCATAHYDDAEAVRDAIDGSTCGACEGEMNVSVGCEPAAEPADDEATGPGNTTNSTATPDAGPATAEPTDIPGEEPTGLLGRYDTVVRQVRRLLREVSPRFWR